MGASLNLIFVRDGLDCGRADLGIVVFVVGNHTYLVEPAPQCEPPRPRDGEPAGKLLSSVVITIVERALLLSLLPLMSLVFSPVVAAIAVQTKVPTEVTHDFAPRQPSTL